MSKSPAFQFYAADYLADEKVQVMSLEEEGIYIRLLAYCWREGSIPADPVLIARLVGKSANGNAIEVVKKCFDVSAKNPSRLIHHRLEKERRKQAENRKNKSEGGKRGANSRWRKGVTDDGIAITMPSQNDGIPTVLPMAENGSSSSISSSISVSSSSSISPSGLNAGGDGGKPPSEQQAKPSPSKFIRPTIDEVREHVRARGSTIDPEKFHAYYEAQGWMLSNKLPMKSWQSAIVTWEKRDGQQQGNGNSRGSGPSGGVGGDPRGNMGVVEEYLRGKRT